MDAEPTLRESFDEMLVTAKRALRVKYKPNEADSIEWSFRNEPAEIIAIAARDAFNAMTAEKKAKRKKGD